MAQHKNDIGTITPVSDVNIYYDTYTAAVFIPGYTFYIIRVYVTVLFTPRRKNATSRRAEDIGPVTAQC